MATSVFALMPVMMRIIAMVAIFVSARLLVKISGFEPKYEVEVELGVLAYDRFVQPC